MSGRVQVTGLEELMRDLTHAPDDIRREGMDIVRETTEGAAAELKNAYGAHRVTGTLSNRVKVTYPASGALIGVVQSTAPHSHLFEWGTKDRKTDAGANRGKMPAGDRIVGIARKWRDRMETRLMAMLANKGYLVSRT